MSKENKKISVVYNQQRWDVVRLIKGFDTKEEADKLRQNLEDKEVVYDEIYAVEEIEIEEMYYPYTTCVICKCAKNTEKCFTSIETKEDFCIDCVRKYSLFYLLNKIRWEDFKRGKMEELGRDKK